MIVEMHAGDGGGGEEMKRKSERKGIRYVYVM